MIEFGGLIYYVDMDELEKNIVSVTENDIDTITEKKIYYDLSGVVTHSELHSKESPKSREINGARYELLRMMLDVVLIDNGNEETDDTMGAERALGGMTLSYKIAFNTLLKYNVIKEVEL